MIPGDMSASVPPANAAGPVATSPDGAAAASPALRVLVVDDSRTARLILKKALPRELLRDLTEADGGAQALALCEQHAFDLMFLDLTMPQVDGYAVLEKLRDSSRRPKVVVVVSADSQLGARERVLSLGARAFLKKTPSPAEIAAILGSL